MVKKTVIAIIVVVLLVAILTGASHRWGYTRYGAVYYYGSPYSYYPLYQYPYSPYSYYNYPSYAYPYYYGPLSSQYMYRYGAPTSYYQAPSTSYPYYQAPSYQAPTPTVGLPRGTEGQLCGMSDGQQYGCEYGLVCDYTKTQKAGIGVCSTQAGVTY